MSDATTILLTHPHKRLVDQVRVERPELRIVAIGDAAPEDRFGGPIYGFIDWLLPGGSGLELCRCLRQARNTGHAHLTLVLETGDAAARRRSLDAGADDYLVGPLTAEMLLARIDGGGRTKRNLLTCGGLSLDRSGHRVRYRGRIVAVRPLEFRLLSHLLEHPDQVFSRAALIGHVWTHCEGIDGRAVDVCVGRLRRALTAAGAPDPLRTVRSVGYVLDTESL